MRKYLDLLENDLVHEIDIEDSDMNTFEGYIDPSRLADQVTFHMPNNNFTSFKSLPTDHIRTVFANNNLISTLKGLPENMKGALDVSNNKLKTLKYSPKSINGFFDCRYNHLTSLEHGPILTNAAYDCSGNPLTSLKGLPKFIGANLYIEDITTLKPWDMRYILFSTINGTIYTFDSELSKILNDFNKLTDDDKNKNLVEMLEQLRNFQ